MDLLTETCTTISYLIEYKHSNKLVMARVNWKIFKYSRKFVKSIRLQFHFLKLLLLSLFHNDFADWYYIGDTLMEPLFWFVDHFTRILGPVSIIFYNFPFLPSKYWNAFLHPIKLFIKNLLIKNSFDAKISGIFLD